MYRSRKIYPAVNTERPLACTSYAGRRIKESCTVYPTWSNQNRPKHNTNIFIPRHIVNKFSFFHGHVHVLR